MKDSRPNSLAVVRWIVLVLATGTVAGCDLGSEQPCSEFRFDREEWVAEDTRQEVADDLVRCEVLMGMTRREVRAMLGAPDESGRDRGRTYFDYFIGAERTIFVVDGEFLSVGFSARGRVDEVETYTG